MKPKLARIFISLRSLVAGGLLLLLIAACSFSSPCSTYAAVSTTGQVIAGDQQLSDLALDSVLILPGDLPDGFCAGKLRHTAEGDMAAVAREAISYASQQIFFEDEFVGSVSVLLYEDPELAMQEYDGSVDRLKERQSKQYIHGEMNPIQGIGEKASVGATIVFPGLDTSGGTSYRLKFTNLVFYQCHALVDISITGDFEEAILIGFASRLSERLQDLTCR